MTRRAAPLLVCLALVACSSGDASSGVDDGAPQIPVDSATSHDASDARADVAVDDSTSEGDTEDAADGTGPSGAAMPTGDLAGWKMIFSDDFTTDVPLGSFPAAVSTKWSAYPDGWSDTSKNGTYMPSKVISVHDGALFMHLHTEGGVHMVSAPEPKLPGAVGGEGGLLYGRYVARFRADAVVGYKTAWLLWPDSEVWPRDGEIDFPEGNLDSTIGAFMHRMNGTSGSDQDAYPSTAKYTTWHTAVLEWTASACRFELDGVTLGTSTSRIPSTPMHWVLQTETALDGTVPTDAAAGDVEIDWVVVYVPA